ncbi:nascent polypeptide-associated complex subunit alpha, muscle-specific form-like [Symphalangus syndactylus]|uniref:nascent polypeptide-associated complex subunit alpha, muscle-specific form-like n=1 Tax=Symphalangus syndactylus TaxID=9590 RepID=UPI00300456C5
MLPPAAPRSGPARGPSAEPSPAPRKVPGLAHPAPQRRAPAVSLPTPAPRDPSAVQGRASCPEARRAKSPLQPAAPEPGGAVSGGRAPGRRAVAVAGCRFLALEVLSHLVESGAALALPALRTGNVAETTGPARPGTSPTPASRTWVSSLFRARGPRTGRRGEPPVVSVCFYTVPRPLTPSRPHPGLGPTAKGRGVPGRVVMAGESGTSALGRRAPRPSGGVGEGRCANYALSLAKRQPRRAAAVKGIRTRTPCPTGLAPHPTPSPCGAHRICALGRGQARTPPPHRRDSDRAVLAPPSCAPPGPHLVLFPFQVEEMPLSRRSGASPAPRIPGWRDASRPRGLVAPAGRRTRRRALPGLAWACSEPSCFSVTTQIGGIWRFSGSPAAKLRGKRGLEACTTCSPRPSMHPGCFQRCSGLAGIREFCCPASIPLLAAPDTLPGSCSVAQAEVQRAITAHWNLDPLGSGEPPTSAS